MIARIALSLCLIIALCTPMAGQGGCTSTYLWHLSGGSSVDPAVQASPYWLSQLAQLIAQYGGGPAICSYYWWSNPQDHSNDHWYGDCTSQPEYTCTGTPAPPPSGAQETTPGPGCPQCGQPINLTTGNTYIQQTDIKVPGLNNGLTLTRTWNSLWPPTQSGTNIGLFGPNWRSTYEERIFVGSDGTVKYARADGSFWSFLLVGNATSYEVIAPANTHATLAYGSSSWTLTFTNGEQRRFDVASGNLVSIVDRNGNTTQVSYDSIARVTTITDPASRHLYFNYGSGSSRLVTGITSDVSLSLSYAYDTSGRLIQVTKPDQTTLSFTYDSNSMITAVKNSDGKVLESHTYDSNGRGLTSSRAGGVEALSVSYPSQ